MRDSLSLIEQAQTQANFFRKETAWLLNTLIARSKPFQLLRRKIAADY